MIAINENDGKVNIGKEPNIRSAVVRSGDFGYRGLCCEFTFDDVVCTVIVEADACLHSLDDDYDGFCFRVDGTDLSTVKISDFLHLRFLLSFRFTGACLPLRYVRACRLLT